MAKISAVGAALRAVTPSDTTDLALGSRGYPRCLYVGVTGNVAVIALGDDSAVTLSNVPVGWFPIAVKKVMSTNTTASSIVALYDE